MKKEIIKPTTTDSNFYTPKPKEYDIALRPDFDGKLDDIVVNNVRWLHLERMSNNSWWFMCKLNTDEEIHFNMFPTVDGFETQVRNCPETLDYEKGSITKGIDDK